ncbi:hypothetical protein GCM10009555_016770 [Acrocarpospora macrocephala]|uniref:Uncharacterized protein n=1 Tax=Acrocarpospora macrocephala TaxID=150177 RepID=A0A5M3WE47_9ACTN|nr:hypothetical protein [Acrocarpospora macrocephala]GES07337.1 hypothetical protein Amac_009320 [Acrocarpospora macrocephala]
MGLNIVVGILADPELQAAADEVGEEFSAIREALAKAGLPDWAEPDLDPTETGDFQMSGYSGLHCLRRLAVHLAETGALPALADTREAADDPLVAEVYTRRPHYAVEIGDSVRVIGSAEDATGGFDHLVQHSDCEGFYVPVDFEPVLIDERVTGGYIGSSQRLLEECRRIAERLGLPEDLDPWSDKVDEAIEDRRTVLEGWQRYGVESFTCLQLMAAARQSIATGAAVVFC